MQDRVQKIIANAGYCSRRAAEDLIEQGAVKVNGKKITLGDKADFDKDTITVQGKVLKQPPKLYLALYKPDGYETTLYSPQKRRTIKDLLKIKERVIPIGRLDMDSEGLLLLTNDGDFANKVMHPRYEKEKEYEVTVMGRVRPELIRKLEYGVRIKTGRTHPAKIVVKKSGKYTKLNITIHEGKNRQIRRMMQAVGTEVVSLKRVRIGPINLGGLKPGQYRKLGKAEIEKLLEK